MYYRDESHRQNVARNFIKREGKTGYTVGRWKRSKSYPYEAMLDGTAIVYECLTTGYIFSNAARKWGRKNGHKFISKKTPKGIEVWKLY